MNRRDLRAAGRRSMMAGAMMTAARPLVADEDGVTVVIPAYNEGPGIGPVLVELRAELDRIALPTQIIVVDDGSRDDTAAQVEAFVDDRLSLVRPPYNRGYGAAIKTGVAQARYPWILITDADGTYPAKFIAPILEERKLNQMVVGARIGETAHIPLLRRPPKWVLRRLASYLCRYRIPDLNSGLRLMRKDLLERYERMLPNQFSFTTTITLAMLSSGYQVKYLPIDYLKRKGKSKIRPIADTINFLILIIRTITYFNPLRVFLPLSLLFFFASVGVGVGSYTITGTLMDVTTVLLFVTSIQLLGLGMLADVMSRRL